MSEKQKGFVVPKRIIASFAYTRSSLEGISINFVEGLPKSERMTLIFVVVDRLSKFGHFIPTSHPYFGQQIAKEFFKNIFKMYGLPKSIVSDRDPIFFEQILAGIVQAARHLIQHGLSVPSADGWSDKSHEQNYGDVSEMLLFR